MLSHAIMSSVYCRFSGASPAVHFQWEREDVYNYTAHCAAGTQKTLTASPRIRDRVEAPGKCSTSQWIFLPWEIQNSSETAGEHRTRKYSSTAHSACSAISLLAQSPPYAHPYESPACDRMPQGISRPLSCSRHQLEPTGSWVAAQEPHT